MVEGERRAEKKVTKRRKTGERGPKLTLLSVSGTIVECQLETGKQKTVTFKFDCEDLVPTDIAKNLVVEDLLSESHSEIFAAMVQDIMRQVKAKPGMMPVVTGDENPMLAFTTTAVPQAQSNIQNDPSLNSVYPDGFRMDQRVPEMTAPTYPFGISEPPSSTGTPTSEPVDFNSEPVVTAKPPVSPMRVSRFQVSVISETKSENDTSVSTVQQQPAETVASAPTSAADGTASNNSNNNTSASTPTVSAIRKGRFSVVTHKSEDVEDFSSSVPTPTTTTACSSSTDLSQILPKANTMNQMPHHGQPLTSLNQLPGQPGQYYAAVPGQPFGSSAFVGAVPSLQVRHDTFQLID